MARDRAEADVDRRIARLQKLDEVCRWLVVRGQIEKEEATHVDVTRPVGRSRDDRGRPAVGVGHALVDEQPNGLSSVQRWQAERPLTKAVDQVAYTSPSLIIEHAVRHSCVHGFEIGGFCFFSLRKAKSRRRRST